MHKYVVPTNPIPSIRRRNEKVCYNNQFSACFSSGMCLHLLALFTGALALNVTTTSIKLHISLLLKHPR